MTVAPDPKRPTPEMVLVPRERTFAMTEAGYAAMKTTGNWTAAYDAALAARPAEASEDKAAAWLCEDLIVDGQSVVVFNEHRAARHAANEWKVTPLYTRPDSTAPTSGSTDDGSLDGHEPTTDIQRSLDAGLNALLERYAAVEGPVSPEELADLLVDYTDAVRVAVASAGPSHDDEQPVDGT